MRTDTQNVPQIKWLLYRRALTYPNFIIGAEVAMDVLADTSNKVYRLESRFSECEEAELAASAEDLR
jgi:hypothetical protein